MDNVSLKDLTPEQLTALIEGSSKDELDVLLRRAIEEGLVHSSFALTFSRSRLQSLSYFATFYSLIANRDLFMEAIQTVEHSSPSSEGDDTDDGTADEGAEQQFMQELRVQLGRSWAHFTTIIRPDDFERIGLEMVITRTVDALDYYLSEILREVFTQRPETLRSAEQVTVEEVLECGTIDEFLWRITDKKVLDLAYKGLPDLIKYLNKEMKLQYDKTTVEFQNAYEFLEVRNIIVHNGGRVSRRYLQNTGRQDLAIGELYPLTYDYVIQGVRTLGKLVDQLDTKFLTHFKLELAPPDDYEDVQRQGDRGPIGDAENRESVPPQSSTSQSQAPTPSRPAPRT